MIDKNIASLLSGANIPYEQNIRLWEKSTFRVGGIAPLGVFPRNVSEAVVAFSILRECSADFHVIGKGSNLLFADGEHKSVFVFTERIKDLYCDGTKIYAGAGVTLASLATFASELSLSGLEFAKGIPGSVGGAVYMNAGAFGSQMSDVLVSSRALDTKSVEIEEVTFHGFGYRKSVYMEKPSLICLGATLELKQGNRETINAVMKEYAEKRRASQPLELPSAGSYFKRPEGNFAGKLIEDAGLKGYRIGAAAVSEKHAGFIVNLGGATAFEILELEKFVRTKVFEKFGVMLEREVEFID